jgi:hypothetical protein
MNRTQLFAAVIATLAILSLPACSRKKKEDAAADAVANAVILGLKKNPNIEILKTDNTKREVTYREKKSGQEVTISFDDLSQGKFNMKMKDARGRESSISSGAAGGMTITGPDGKMTISGGAASSSAPAWVPAYPGATPAAGSMRMEKGDTLSGSSHSETKDSVAKVKEFFDSKLKEQGYKTEAMIMNLDGKDNASVTGTKKDGDRKTSITVSISAVDGKTAVMTYYEGPKN